MADDSANVPWPPGQRARRDFPRFGLLEFAGRFPARPSTIELKIGGAVARPGVVSHSKFESLPRSSRTADFHCVTTWSVRGLVWEGVRFADFFREVIQPDARPEPSATFVVLRCQDGYRACLPLEDLLAGDVLLADRLNGEPLPVEHGAPLRLVAPAHYGYKSAKHLDRIDFWRDDSRYKPAALRFMEHPRARVALEERGLFFPGWFLRYLYRPLIGPTVARFRRAMARDTDRHSIPP